MNSKLKKALLQVRDQKGLKYDQKSDTLYGNYNGYDFTLHVGSYNLCIVQFSLSTKEGSIIENSETKKLKTVSKVITVAGNNGYRVILQMNLGRFKTAAKTLEKTLDELTSTFMQQGYINCCQNCGQIKTLSTYIMGYDYELVCDDCASMKVNDFTAHTNEVTKKSENIVGGIIGACLGSLVGVLAIVLLSKLGYVASFSGVIGAGCAFKGYEMLAGKISKKGFIITCLIIAISVYFGNKLSIALIIADYINVDVFTSFRSLNYLMENGYLDKAIYYSSLAKVALYAAVGAIATGFYVMKDMKVKHVIRALEDNV